MTSLALDGSSVAVAPVVLRRTPAAWGLVMLFGFLLFASGGVVTNDSQSASHAAWALATQGSPDVSGERWLTRWDVETSRGVVTDRFLGVWVAAVPAYAVAGWLGLDVFSLLPGRVTAAALAVLAVGLVGRLLGWRVAAVVAASVPLTSVVGAALWPHSVTAPALVGALLAVRARCWWAVGVLVAVAITARPTVALAAAVLGVGLALAERCWRPVLVIGAWSVLAVAVLWLWAWWLGSGGSPVVGSYSGQFERATDVAGPFSGLGWWQVRGQSLAGLLVSPQRGWLLYVPALAVLLVAVRGGWRQSSTWVKVAAAAGVAVVAGQLMGNGFAAGVGFAGPRYGLEAVVLALPLLERAEAALGRAGRLTLRVAVLFGAVLAVVLALGFDPSGSLTQPVPWPGAK